MGTVIRLLYRHKLISSLELNKMMTRTFIIILVIALIGYTFAEDVDHQKGDEFERNEVPEEVERGYGGYGYGDGLGGIGNHLSCKPRGSLCRGSLSYCVPQCCSGLKCVQKGHGGYYSFCE